MKARTSAAALVEAGHVRINGVREKAPGHSVKAGDVLTIGLDRSVRVLRVLRARVERRVLADRVLRAVVPRVEGVLPLLLVVAILFSSSSFVYRRILPNMCLYPD